MCFIIVYTEWSGYVHDSRVFRYSPIPAELEKMGSNEHILGDCLPPLHISSLDLGMYAPERRNEV